jgi:hypothetical protein
MRRGWQLVVLVLLVVWFIGAFVVTIGRIIHLFLLGAIVVLVMRSVAGKKKNRTDQ